MERSCGTGSAGGKDARSVEERVQELIKKIYICKSKQAGDKLTTSIAGPDKNARTLMACEKM
eukprot:6157812-Pleurochrysis_carterae.AAC.3